MNNSNSPINDGFPKIYGYKPKATPKAGKTSILWFILNLIFLVIFNVFFFLLGELPHNASVWMSYGFIHFAYFMLVVTPMLVRKGKSSAVFGFALFTVSTTYFIIAFIVGVIFILIAPESFAAALLVQLSIAGIYGIMLIVNMIANEHTADSEASRQHQIDYIKTASSQLQRIIGGVEDKTAKRKVEKVYDIVNSSPVKSHANVQQIEMRILTLIDELADAVQASDNQAIISISDSLAQAVNGRNNQLRNLQA